MADRLRSIFLPSKIDGDSLTADPAFWSRDAGEHFLGDFSYAVVRANNPIEDHSQVETCNNGTYVGIYDGHAGPAASQYVCEHLFNTHLIGLLQQNDGTISLNVIRNAFAATENGFFDLVRLVRETNPLVQTVGSCCLVGIIRERTLYVANLGDSRAVIGHMVGRKITAQQLTTDHNVKHGRIKEQVWSANWNDPDIVQERRDGSFIKGMIQVSRAIGDAYLKSAEYDVGGQFPHFRLHGKPLERPAISAVPEIHVKALGPNDRFVIFASDGFWDLMSNQKAVERVNKYSREGIAKRLLRYALGTASKRFARSYSEIQSLGARRRDIHDDITVVVLFIEQENRANVEAISVRAYNDDEVSRFDNL